MTAMVLDVVVLIAFLWVKLQSDVLVIYASIVGVLLILAGERWFLSTRKLENG